MTELVIPPEVAERMDRALIATEDAARVVDHCETTGMRLLDNETGDMIGHLRHGALTYWVRYRHEDNAALLIDIYCHRAALEEARP